GPALRLLHGHEWHYGLRHAFANANSDSNRNSHAHTYANGHVYSYTYSYSYCYGHRDCYCYTNAYFHTETDPDAKRYGFAKAAPDSAAAAVGPGGERCSRSVKWRLGNVHKRSTAKQPRS